MPNLYIVATPIGNLEDITFRAVRILSDVDLIAAEDTRKTKILLDKYNIKKPLSSYHKFNIRAKTSYFIGKLKEGSNIALVTDAGMPGISDPGHELIKAALDANLNVVSIPGPSAAITALSVSGLPTDRFVFEGFLPRKHGRKVKRLKELNVLEETIVIYESPFRVIKTLKDVLEVMGNRKAAVCRELTKKFEEVIRGAVSELIAKLENYGRIKGEIVLVIEGGSDGE